MRYAIVIERAESKHSAYGPNLMREDGMTLPEPTAIVGDVDA